MTSQQSLVNSLWILETVSGFQAYDAHPTPPPPILEKNNDEYILILVIYWKKTELLLTKISNHNIICSS